MARLTERGVQTAKVGRHSVAMARRQRLGRIARPAELLGVRRDQERRQEPKDFPKRRLRRGDRGAGEAQDRERRDAERGDERQRAQEPDRAWDAPDVACARKERRARRPAVLAESQNRGSDRRADDRESVTGTPGMRTIPVAAPTIQYGVASASVRAKNLQGFLSSR